MYYIYIFKICKKCTFGPFSLSYCVMLFFSSSIIGPNSMINGSPVLFAGLKQGIDFSVDCLSIWGQFEPVCCIILMYCKVAQWKTSSLSGSGQMYRLSSWWVFMAVMQPMFFCKMPSPPQHGLFPIQMSETRGKFHYTIQSGGGVNLELPCSLMKHCFSIWQ